MTDSMYVNADGTVCTGWVDGAGVRYYYDKEGKRQADTVVKIGKKLYGFDGSGVLLESGMYVRSESDGKVTYTRTSDISSASYMVDPDGSVTTGWYALKDDTGAVTGQYYFSQDTGAKLKDVHKIGTGRYYFDRDTGLMRTSAGWIDEDGASEGEAGHHRYYVNQNGELATGWLSLDDGIRYYLGKDGERRDGVLKVGVRLYFQTPAGIVTADNAENVVKAVSSGITKTVLCRIDDDLIYVNQNGVLKTGLQKIDGSRYYFDKTKGSALTGYQQISGRWYRFDAAGVLCE
jgi:glucan-binding YG repeat protein